MTPRTAHTGRHQDTVIHIGMPKWYHQAACANTDPEAFFDEYDYRAAQRLCKVCPVRFECLREALQETATGQLRVEGVWGGLTERARRDLVRMVRRGYNAGTLAAEYLAKSEPKRWGFLMEEPTSVICA
jgi:hypothetical protein